MAAGGGRTRRSTAAQAERQVGTAQQRAEQRQQRGRVVATRVWCDGIFVPGVAAAPARAPTARAAVPTSSSSARSRSSAPPPGPPLAAPLEPPAAVTGRWARAGGCPRRRAARPPSGTRGANMEHAPQRVDLDAVRRVLRAARCAAAVSSTSCARRAALAVGGPAVLLHPACT